MAPRSPRPQIQIRPEICWILYRKAASFQLYNLSAKPTLANSISWGPEDCESQHPKQARVEIPSRLVSLILETLGYRINVLKTLT